jgi:spore maturation protein CgeB
MYSRAGAPEVRFLPQAVDPGEDYPAESVPARYRCEVSFVGSGQYPDRHALLRAIADVADLQIRGLGWGRHDQHLPVRGGRVRGRRLAQVIAGAAISLGAAATGAQAEAPLCISNRVWKVLGCGGFYLGPWTRGMELLVREHQHCALFRSDQDAIAQVRYWLERPEERAAIARAGRAHALARHTYAHRLELLLRGESFPYTTS